MTWLLICLVIKKLNKIVTDLFSRERKLDFSLAFKAQSHVAVTKIIRLNLTLFFVMKTPNKHELQQIALHYSSDIDFKALWIFTKMLCKTIFFFIYWCYYCIR